ncbi:hypothetical protein ACFQY5_15340 [Paeniroseomonas aquatica]|uniref:hypothetical protein n=1 Tax=Paeniroseomonas aquatica TaxID=373043 RepID=UPI0036083A8C
MVRIGLESDRVTEERRIYARCETCPPRIILGEQVQLEIETGRLPNARLVPENAVEGFDGATGRVWTIEGARCTAARSASLPAPWMRAWRWTRICRRRWR